MVFMCKSSLFGSCSKTISVAAGRLGCFVMHLILQRLMDVRVQPYGL